MGQIISKSSLQWEKEIWNPKSNEFEIKSNAVRRNKHVQKLWPPPPADVILGLLLLPSFFSHQGRGRPNTSAIVTPPDGTSS